jgi:phosphoribosyl 1,2-cyclic phosphate phosphodiesterase
MKITILGSGTSTGVPMVGCRCPVCSSNDPRDKRTRASILIETTGGIILVDTSPDLRRQALRHRVPHIDAVLLTHSHADHVNGIDDLRGFHFIHRRIVPCYGSRDTLDAVKKSFPYIFRGHEIPGYAPLLEPHVIHDTFSLFGQTIVPIHLFHGAMPATGYRIGGAAYLTDCSRIPESSLALLSGLDLLIIDGLRYTPHENHFNIAGALAVVKQLQPRQAVLTHLTHEVPHADEARLPAGVQFAYDGMELAF